MRVWAVLGWCVAATAHQYHYSRTEIDWIAKKGSVQIIATLHADDVELRIRRAERREIELDRDKDAEALVCRYVTSVIELEGVKLKCLGMKVGRHFVDVYMEGAAARAPGWMKNRVLTEELEDQRNDVELKRDGKLLGPRVMFNAAETRKTLKW